MTNILVLLTLSFCLDASLGLRKTIGRDGRNEACGWSGEVDWSWKPLLIVKWRGTLWQWDECCIGECCGDESTWSANVGAMSVHGSVADKSSKIFFMMTVLRSAFISLSLDAMNWPKMSSLSGLSFRDWNEEQALMNSFQWGFSVLSIFVFCKV